MKSTCSLVKKWGSYCKRQIYLLTSFFDRTGVLIYNVQNVYFILLQTDQDGEFETCHGGGWRGGEKLYVYIVHEERVPQRVRADSIRQLLR